MFPVKEVRLSDVARLGTSTINLLDREVDRIISFDELPKVLVGRCYALNYQLLYLHAKELQTSWHRLLLYEVIAGLWEERLTKPALAAYWLTGIVRLFVFTKSKKSLHKLQARISRIAGYIESGIDSTDPRGIRPLALWEPPSSMMALWPLDYYGRVPRVASVVDTGALMSFYSYPESDHNETIPVEQAGPDYVRVPTTEHEEVTMYGKTYTFMNRWTRIVN